jgi:DNA-binding CsgD family transcriptional regulator
MDEAETVSALIGDIYDAALDPSLWPHVIMKLAAYVGGQAGGIVTKDAISKSGTPYFHYGFDPHYVSLYAETHSKYDPLTALPLYDVGQIVSVPDLVPYEEYRRERFFLEWMRPQGWVDAASSVLEKSATSCSLITVLRSETRGLVDDEMRRRMALVVPHARRAVLIGNIIDLKTAEAASLADTLDGLNAGMFLVDDDARIVHANISGHLMFSQGAVLRSSGGRLLANQVDANQSLKETFAAAGAGDAAVGIKGIAVPMQARGGERYVAHVLPLTSGARRRAGANYAAVAAVFVHKANMDTPSPLEAIARTYRLTPTELRVLLAIVQVGGVAETAEALGTAEGTVKTHLHRLFAKTETRRQAELVKLVAGYSSPLVG